jgi:hypothetical protein
MTGKSHAMGFVFPYSDLVIRHLDFVISSLVGRNRQSHVGWLVTADAGNFRHL